jgi:hypothetical protein
MASIQAVGCRDDGTVLIDVKDNGRSVVIRMSPDVAMKIFIELGITIDKARDLWEIRRGEYGF